MPAASPCRLPTFGAVGEVVEAPAAAVSGAWEGTVGIAAAGSPSGTAGGAAGARAICEPAADAAGAAVPSAARVAPVRDDALAGSASRSWDGVESRCAGSGGTWTAMASARTPSATPIPGSDIVSCAALAAVSGAAGSGEPKIHAASAHNTKLRARTRIPESRVMVLPFVAGSDDAGHDSPIAGRCAGQSRRRPSPRTGFVGRIVRNPPSPSGVRLPPSPTRRGQGGGGSDRSGGRPFNFRPSGRPRGRAPPARRRSSARESRGRGSTGRWPLRGGG